MLDALDSSVLGCAEFESIAPSDVSRTIRECLWQRMADSLRGIASEITLDDLAAHYYKVTEDNLANLMYYI